ncbi:MAG: O-antigen ligase family protein [Gemmatimonadota bacterium]
MNSATLDLRDGRRLALLGLVPICLLVAFAVVYSPWIISGVLFGALLLLLVIFRPLVLVAFMLAIGPADLSFITGGFKALFPEVGGLDMNGIRLVGVTAGFLLLLLVQRGVQVEAIGKQGRWYAVFLIYAAASIVTSYSPVDGLRLLLKLAYPFLTFIVVAGLVEREEELDSLVRWTLATSVVVLLLNPFMLVGIAYTVDPLGYKRIGGLGTYANPFSFYLMVVLFISLARFMVRGQMRYLGLCALFGIWIYLTLTRITLLGVFAGIAVMALYAGVARRGYKAMAGPVLVGLLVGVPLMAPALERSLGFMPTPSEVITLIRSPAALYESINWQGRDALWPIVYGSFAGDRLTGLGLGSSTVVLKQYMPAQVGYVPHNEYLRLASEAGLIGVALFFLAILKWFIGAWRAGLAASPRGREFALAALGGIVGWACVALTDNPFDYYSALTQYIGFLCAGAMLCARFQDGGDQAAPL